mgnify:CR=1 FL=1
MKVEVSPLRENKTGSGKKELSISAQVATEQSSPDSSVKPRKRIFKVSTMHH